MASVSGSVITKRAPLPGSLRHFDLAAELLHVPAHHVEADAAAGDVGGLLGGGEAGQEDELVDLLVGERIVRADEAARARLGEDAVASRPPPSSLTSTAMLPPRWQASRCSVPTAGLPLATRTSGISMPWSMLLRTRCTSGSPIFSSTVLSSSVSRR